MDRVCSIDGCTRKVKARDVCSAHYRALDKKGSRGRSWDDVEIEPKENFRGPPPSGYTSIHLDLPVEYSVDAHRLWLGAVHHAFLALARLEDLEDAKKDEYKEILEAVYFLFATRGQWKESREDVCYAAGLGPENVRARAWQELDRMNISLTAVFATLEKGKERKGS